MWHLAFEGAEYPPLELRAPVSTSDPGRYVENMLRAFGIGNERLEWIIAPSDWP